MYADRVTDSMRQAIDETERRRQRQIDYNAEHGITPITIKKALFDMDPSSGAHDFIAVPLITKDSDGATMHERIEALRAEMLMAAEGLEFEKAAKIRDAIRQLEQTGDAPQKKAPKPRKRR